MEELPQLTRGLPSRYVLNDVKNIKF